MSQIKSWIIGSASECDVIVSEATVSGRHCRLTQTHDGFVLEDLDSTNGTYVNGRRLSTSIAVRRDDAITLGKTIPMPWPADATEPGSVVVRIGHADDNDIILDYPMISGHHARLIIRGAEMVLEDLDSTNGTAVGSPSNKIKTATVSRDDILFLGSFRIPVARLLEGRLDLGASGGSTITFRGQELVLGRDASCDVVLDYPIISGRHARLRKAGGRIILEDLDSTNGTFVNGHQVSGPLVVRPGDLIGLGSYTFQLTEDGSLRKRDYRGNLTIEAQDVAVDVPGIRLLDRVSLTIYPSEFVGLMGPSGAGKTTLMNALNGYTPPSTGKVLFNGRDLYSNYLQFSSLIGYVPQDDIIHRELTVKQALYYTAKLRLPPDTSDSEIERRIQTVLKELGLEGTENVIVGSPDRKGISGGQRKRVNLAMELLTEPSVLFLDEPTSGLSSEDALMVMKLLRGLADSGKTILLTIHQPSLDAYRLMDNLLLVSKDQNSVEPGRLVYYGPAYPDAVHFFNPDDSAMRAPGNEPSPDEVLRGLAKRPTREWSDRYDPSDYHREYVRDRAGRQVGGSEPTKAARANQPNPFGQMLTLVRRCLSIKVSDRWMTTILLAQAPIVALLIVLVYGHHLANVQDHNFTLDQAEDEWKNFVKRCGICIFLTGLSALWFGCSNAAREIVGEWPIYHRERMVNLRIFAYIGSKFVSLGVLCIIQCTVLLSVVHNGCDLKLPFFPAFGILLLVSLIGLGIGLCISALARTSEVAVGLTPIILIPMVILGGIMTDAVEQESAPVKFLSRLAPSRWAFEGMFGLESEGRPRLVEHLQSKSVGEKTARTDDLPDRTAGRDVAEVYFPQSNRTAPGRCAIVLFAMVAIIVAAIHLILRARDVH